VHILSFVLRSYAMHNQNVSIGLVPWSVVTNYCVLCTEEPEENKNVTKDFVEIHKTS